MDRPEVSLRRCPAYAPGEVQEALSRCLSDLGGMGRFIRRGERTVLKVNLLRAASPGEGVTTHPAVVLALSKEVERAGGVPLVADCPSGQVSAARLNRIYEKAGLLGLERQGKLWLNRDLSAARVSNPKGRILRSVDILRVVKEADAVITVPKLKTHTLTGMTGATKILYGIIPGLAKAGYHAKLPDVRDFCELQLDLVALVNPRLAVMDGILGMEGNGPSVGEPRWGRVLMASPDSAALDLAAAMIMMASPDRVPILSAAIARGLCPAGLEAIRLLGDPLESLRAGPWRMPTSRVGLLENLSGKVPAPMLRRMGDLLVQRPVPDRKLCRACGDCARNCPQKCIRIVNDVPRIDYSRCISCFCCAETCPGKAMKIREPPLSL